jgi:3-methyladenine DNA glycosylase AlkD
MQKIIDDLRKDLRSESSEPVRIAGERFFREEIHLYGIKSATVGKIGKEYFSKLKGLPKEKIFELCEELWKSGMFEEAAIACNWSEYIHRSYELEDFQIFDRWVSTYVSNWAACDTLCNHSVGDIVMMYPELIGRLKVWAKSQNRWVKRAAAVSLIIPARKGMFIDDIIEIAEILHSDTDDMVQKGYGWMLKAASQANEQTIFRYVLSRKATMPRTALRYAIEKMPADLKKQVMAK